MLSQSFSPSEWFADDPDPSSLKTGHDVREAKRMWVYHAVYEGGRITHYEVGYYSPDRVWHVESRHDSPEAAAERVHWLNGGDGLR